MPTNLRRTSVTHTPDLQHALSLAAAKWPGKADGALIVTLIDDWAARVEPELTAARAARAARIRAAAGRFPGLYPPGYLDEIREGWPE